MAEFKCRICGKNYIKKKSLEKHRNRTHTDDLTMRKGSKIYKCLCGASFTRQNNMKVHQKQCAMKDAQPPATFLQTIVDSSS
mmetsp:Transcript_42366/g.31027  ORF Transcript_42366/g.31027 Transcript_42366/m.31027 type:complete len:82 (-) Transcript_42366:765-1010(-)